MDLRNLGRIIRRLERGVLSTSIADPHHPMNCMHCPMQHAGRAFVSILLPYFIVLALVTFPAHLTLFAMGRGPRCGSSEFFRNWSVCGCEELPLGAVSANDSCYYAAFCLV